MAEDKAKSKPKKKPPADGKGKPPGGPPVDEADPTMGAAPSGPPATPMPPPMPGEGVDPYAALAGQISPSPPAAMPGGMGMPPMSPLTGMGGMGPPSGGMAPGSVGMGRPLPMGDMPSPMGPGLEMQPGGAGPMGIGSAIGGGPPGGMSPGYGDEMAAALMGELNPSAGNPELPQHVFDPGQMDQQGISVQQLLEMLTLAQGGIPRSGLEPPTSSRGVGSGIIPGGQPMV